MARKKVTLTIEVVIEGDDLSKEQIGDFEVNLDYDVTSQTEGITVVETEITDFEVGSI